MKRTIKILRYFLVAIVAMVFVSVGIDAADHYDNISQSIVGRLLFGKDSGPCPIDMVFVPNTSGGFCIDKYEASPNDNCVQQKIKSQLNTRDNLDMEKCAPQSTIGTEPWTFVSQAQAMNACAKAGKYLPSSQEWYEASLGTPDKPDAWDKYDCQVNNNWLKQPGLSGSGKNCVSSFGAYDMIGNVWEWVQGEIVDGQFDGQIMPDAGYINDVSSEGMVVATSQKIDPNFNEDYFWIKKSGTRSIARGGYWENKNEAGVYAMYLVSPGAFAGAGVGFRCAKQIIK